MAPPPEAARAAARMQQQVEELCAATLRAMAGRAHLHFRGGRLYLGERRLPIYGPHLRPTLGEDDFASFRGAADGVALRLRLSDEDLHRHLCPQAPLQRWVFDLLEQLRVESLVPTALEGVRANLKHRFERWALAYHDAGGFEEDQGLLLMTLALIARSRVCGEPVPEVIEDALEATRAGIVPALGQDLRGLRRERFDQARYAVHSLAIAQWLASRIESERAARPSAEDEAAATRGQRRFGLLLEVDAEGDAAAPSPQATASRVLEAEGGRYRAFTTAYDREVRAATLVRRALLDEYRERLDRRIAAQGVNIARLTRDLQRLLAEHVDDDWNDGQEEGRIDGRRLARLVSAPADRRLFRLPRVESRTDAVVALLVDCSGSMRQHVEDVAMLVDVLARSLEQAGAASEVLGFTTGAWNGGRALRDWRRAGCPPHPGRLNEVMHLVFKDADTPWRRARRDVAAMLKADLFREGIDGEAVAWACARLEARSESRKLLLVVSDGCPMDAATALANDAGYLDQHLRDVVRQREREGSVRICALGVGLDLSAYYAQSQVLAADEPVGQRAFAEVLRLVGGRRRR